MSYISLILFILPCFIHLNGALVENHIFTIHDRYKITRCCKENGCVISFIPYFIKKYVSWVFYFLTLPKEFEIKRHSKHHVLTAIFQTYILFVIMEKLRSLKFIGRHRFPSVILCHVNFFIKEYIEEISCLFFIHLFVSSTICLSY